MRARPLTLTGEQIRAARALARLDQADLARSSNLSLETIKRLERIRGPVDANSRTLTAISEAFDRLGIEFVSADGVGVQMVDPAAVAPSRQAPRPSSSGDSVGVMHRLIYYSTVEPQAVVHMKEMLDQVLAASRDRNAELGVTGALFACEGRFLQVLEGEKQAVLQVYGAISTDPRHSGLRVVESRPVTSRQFDNWSLCCGKFASDREVLGQEPAMVDGFHPEALTPVSALGLLSVMRDLQQSAPRNARGWSGPCPLVGQCFDRKCAANEGEAVETLTECA